MDYREYRAWIARLKPRRRAHVEVTMTELAQPAPDLDPREAWPEHLMSRCDADHAERYGVRWDSLTGTLKLCPNHSRRHSTALLAAGWIVVTPNNPTHTAAGINTV